MISARRRRKEVLNIHKEDHGGNKEVVVGGLRSEKGPKPSPGSWMGQGDKPHELKCWLARHYDPRKFLSFSFDNNYMLPR